MDGRHETLHAQRVIETVEGRTDATARSAVAASWRRSSTLHRLDPAAPRRVDRRLDGDSFRKVREREGRLIACARGPMDRLFAAVGGVGCSVLLADRDGVAVERRGSPSDDDIFEGWGLWTATLWSESAEGTNGIGTAIADRRPVTIHRDQHFFARNALLSCTSAPIHDAEGLLAGVLDVSSCRADLTEGFLTLIAQSVGDAARRIEAEVFRAAFPQARILLAPSLEARPDGLIAVDRDDLVVGATRAARLALGLSAEDMARPLPVGDLIAPRDGARSAASAGESLAEGERAVVSRALARSKGNVSQAAELLGISRATLHRKINKLGLAGRNGGGTATSID